jgi:hypothetical protein
MGFREKPRETTKIVTKSTKHTKSTKKDRRELWMKTKSQKDPVCCSACGLASVVVNNKAASGTARHFAHNAFMLFLVLLVCLVLLVISVAVGAEVWRGRRAKQKTRCRLPPEIQATPFKTGR